MLGTASEPPPLQIGAMPRAVSQTMYNSSVCHTLHFQVALPKIWYRRQMLGPISSYCAFVWQDV